MPILAITSSVVTKAAPIHVWHAVSGLRLGGKSSNLAWQNAGSGFLDFAIKVIMERNSTAVLSFDCLEVTNYRAVQGCEKLSSCNVLEGMTTTKLKAQFMTTCTHADEVFGC